MSGIGQLYNVHNDYNNLKKDYNLFFNVLVSVALLIVLCSSKPSV